MSSSSRTYILSPAQAALVEELIDARIEAIHDGKDWGNYCTREDPANPDHAECEYPEECVDKIDELASLRDTRSILRNRDAS